MRYRKGDIVQITAGILRGARAVVVHVSKTTGGLTVRLTEDRTEAWKKDAEVNVMPYETQRLAPWG